MDARWSTFVLFAVCLVHGMNGSASAASSELRTQNFIIWDAPDERFAQQVGQAAEAFRSELAIKWVGRELAPWKSPCTLRIVAGNVPAQGVTTYQRYPGHVGDFQMEVVGTPERILDSVLPHEITHAVLATYFGKPLPRWADEGISTTVEHASEKAKHDAKLREFLQTRRGLPMNRMFMLTEYPSDMLPLYAQGYSVCRFLIEQNGHHEFIKFIEDYMAHHSWTDAVRRHYGYESLAELQEYWLAWVAAGSGPVERYAKRSEGAQGQDVQVAVAAASIDSRETGKNPPSVMLASGSAGEGGWYQRRRQSVLAGAASESTSGPAATQVAATQAATTSTPTAPEPYSVAQPQGEQGAISAAPTGAATPWSAGSAGSASMWR